VISQWITVVCNRDKVANCSSPNGVEIALLPNTRNKIICVVRQIVEHGRIDFYLMRPDWLSGVWVVEVDCSSAAHETGRTLHTYNFA
jgi:hypothetical protein